MHCLTSVKMKICTGSALASKTMKRKLLLFCRLKIRMTRLSSPRWMLITFIVGASNIVMVNFLWHLIKDKSAKLRTIRPRHDQAYNCSGSARSGEVEDILCMDPKRFSDKFKNPCWYDNEDFKSSVYKSLQCLPYFYIFGVCKSGTTDFYKRLILHPQILENNGIFGKETWFWSWKRYGHRSKSGHKLLLEDFIHLFKANDIEYNIRYKRSTDSSGFSSTVTGHADPLDFWDHRYWRLIPQNTDTAEFPNVLTPHLVHHVQPNIKLILILREPSERLYSHYFFGGFGDDQHSFHYDVVSGLAILHDCLRLYSLRRCMYGEEIWRRIRLPISASLYHFHLKEWLSVFPREQILVIRNEDYAKDIRTTLHRTFQFLDLEQVNATTMQEMLEIPRTYKTNRKIRKGAMFNETRKILLDFFEKPNKELSDLLKDDRYQWKDCVYYDTIPKRTNQKVDRGSRIQRTAINAQRYKWLHERIRVKKLTLGSDGRDEDLVEWWKANRIRGQRWKRQQNGDHV